MKVMLAFPVGGEEHSTLLHKKTLSELANMYPWDEVMLFDSRHTPFNRAATRNLAVKDALSKQVDVIVLCDADSIPEPGPLAETIDQASRDAKLHIPFDHVKVISKRFADPGRNYRSAYSLYEYGPSCGGIYVINPVIWHYVGGMDERIEGWGYEDQIFLAAVNTFLGGYVNHEGILYNFQHEKGISHSAREDNSKLRDAYHDAQFDKEAFRVVQKGSNEWNK